MKPDLLSLFELLELECRKKYTFEPPILELIIARIHDTFFDTYAVVRLSSPRVVSFRTTLR